jgi:hypothetical protein
MELLGRKNIQNTLIYTQLVEFKEGYEFYTAVAKTTQEAQKRIESGFEYIVTTPEGLMIFKKRM